MGKLLAGVVAFTLLGGAAWAAPLKASLVLASADPAAMQQFGLEAPVLFEAATARELLDPAATVFRAPLLTGFAVSHSPRRPGADQSGLMALGDPESEQLCLARAIYFEARSEPEDGQRAVAAVVINRRNSAYFPGTVCGVVYQGAGRLNGCQFSFACDGVPDIPKPGAAWRRAQSIAASTMSGFATGPDAVLQSMAAATHYHADYADPTWSHTLTRLVKIGRHIFYAQG